MVVGLKLMFLQELLLHIKEFKGIRILALLKEYK